MEEIIQTEGYQYKLTKELGSGAFGGVREAIQEACGIEFRRVALKLFKKSLTDRSLISATEIFNDAIQVVRLLEDCDDPRVLSRFIHIFDIGVARVKQDGGQVSKAFVAMEQMDGDLRGKVGQVGSPNFRKATVTEVLDYMVPVVEAVAYMHAQDPPLVHRDLKPENILFKRTSRGIETKVTDFGLAVQNYNLWDSIDAAGTVPYQDLESFTSNTAAVESDVYAIGVIFYELLTGRYPYAIDFDGIDFQDTMSKNVFCDRLKLAMSNPPVPPSDHNFELRQDAWLEDLILKCLTPYRSDRIKNAAILQRALKKRGVGIISGPITEKTPQEIYKMELQRGKDCTVQGKAHWTNAEEAFQKAIKILPKHCDAYVGLGHLWIEMEQFKKAERLLMERSGQNRDCPHIFKELAYLYGNQGNQDLRDYYLERSQKVSACEFSI